ncbi:MAG: OST-HTH/LOTUS domain-containing protein, partial [Sulfitobacter litoralis]|nr:OST-HTH/LOTUS domain-containing protein [Sulfitobacter litoralis]
KNDPSFDSRNFGYKKLGELVRAQPFIDVDERQGSDGNIQIYVRMKTT